MKRIVTTDQVDRNQVLNYAAPSALVDTASNHSNYSATRPYTGTNNLLHNVTGTLSGNKQTTSNVPAANTKATTKTKATTYTVNAKNQPYVDQLNTLYDQIMNRKPFQYDLNGDLLYRQMADQYTQLGQQAMRDATGTAAALTGGYANSYANQVGNQAYQQYLTALNQNIPDLYDRAYQVYQDQGNQLLQQYELAAAHPGYLDAISPKTYTIKQESAEESGDTSAYLQMLQNLLSSSANTTTTPTTNAQTVYSYNYNDYLKRLMELQG